MTPLLFIHAGLHKTGTTLFQKHIFPNWPGIHYLGKPYVNEKVLEPIVLDREAASVFVLSNEKFSFPMVGPNSIDPDRRANSIGRERLACLQKLKALLPQSGLILGLREPSRWVASLYSQYVLRGGTCPEEKFWAASGPAACVSADDLKFSQLIEVSQSMWDEAFFFDHEELIHDPRALLRDLGVFLGVSEEFDPAHLPHVNARLSRRRLESVLNMNRMDIAHADRRKRVRAFLDESAGEDEDEPYQFAPEVAADIRRTTGDDWRRTRTAMEALRGRRAG